jgi:hypothetical protein
MCNAERAHPCGFKKVGRFQRDDSGIRSEAAGNDFVRTLVRDDDISRQVSGSEESRIWLA